MSSARCALEGLGGGEGGCRPNLATTLRSIHLPHGPVCVVGQRHRQQAGWDRERLWSSFKLVLQLVVSAPPPAPPPPAHPACVRACEHRILYKLRGAAAVVNFALGERERADLDATSLDQLMKAFKDAGPR